MIRNNRMKIRICSSTYVNSICSSPICSSTYSQKSVVAFLEFPLQRTLKRVWWLFLDSLIANKHAINNNKLNVPKMKNGPKIQLSLHIPPNLVRIKIPKPPLRLYNPLRLPMLGSLLSPLSKLILVIIIPICERPMKLTMMKHVAVRGSYLSGVLLVKRQRP